MTHHPHDPRGLIAAAFEIDNITLADCQTIFLNWAISVPQDDLVSSAADLARHFGNDHKDHPMLSVLDAAQGQVVAAGRRRRRQ